MALINAMVSHFDMDSNCFIINDHHLCFGLQDVYFLTGLPITGKPVTGVDCDANGLCIRLLGKENYLVVKNKGKENNGDDDDVDDGPKKKDCVNLNQLRNDFATVPQGIDNEGLDKYVRAYVLYIIGSVIATDEENTCVPTMYLALLENVDEIKTYAWGAALLANIYVEIRKFKNSALQPTSRHSRHIRASMIFVQVNIIHMMNSLLFMNFHIYL